MITHNMQLIDNINIYFCHEHLKPQDSFGRLVNIFLDLQKVDRTIRKHH